MLTEKKAVYYICNDEKRQGLVSRTVWNILIQKGFLVSAGMTFDGQDVMMYEDKNNNAYFFVPTEVPVCWNYPKYLPEMNAHFGNCDIAGMVTWHEGSSAPPKVLTIHTIGDVNAGVFSPADPFLMRNLFHALEKNRRISGLDDYQTVTEATHWSGTYVTGSSPKLILQYPVPMIDIEVGSEEESWANRTACKALADSLIQVFDSDEKRVRNILCVGGVHFEPSFAQAASAEWDNEAFGISHILANQWLVAGEYENEYGLAYASAAVDAIAGSIEAIAFHDKMKGCYKDLVRALGEKYHVPILKHQRLRDPAEVEWNIIRK